VETSFVPSPGNSHKKSWVANAYDNNIYEPVRVTAMLWRSVIFTCLEMLWLSSNRISYSKENLRRPLPSLPLLSRPLPSSLCPSVPFLHPSSSLKCRSSLFQLGDLSGLREHSKLSQRGLGQSPSRNGFWCILALKSDIWWQLFSWEWCTSRSIRRLSIWAYTEVDRVIDHI